MGTREREGGFSLKLRQRKEMGVKGLVEGSLWIPGPWRVPAMRGQDEGGIRKNGAEQEGRDGRVVLCG